MVFFLLATAYVKADIAQQRIVSAGGSVTEVLFALGLGDQIVAVDTSSLYPPQALAKPKVGYYRQLSPEGVLSVNPTILIGHGEMGPQSVVKQISNTGIEVIHVKESHSVDGIFGLISTLSKRFNRQEMGKKLIQNIKQDLSSTPTLSEKNVHAAFFLSVGDRGIIAAGQHTMPQGLMNAIGVVNSFASVDGYKPVSSEALLSQNPNFIMLADHSLADQDTQALCLTPAIKLWAQLNGCKIFPVDSLQFMGLSPRVANAYTTIYQLSQRSLIDNSVK